MRILIAIVHYWNPSGGGRHQSLRPDPQPRVDALTNQLLSLRRIGNNQSILHMQDKAIYRVNDSFRHSIDIAIVTDGLHHVLDRLPSSYANTFTNFISSPRNSLHLGFEAQKFLAAHLDDDYDLYCYLEDDLIIHDPLFFSKVQWFTELMGHTNLLLPHRYELCPYPHAVDRFYIDGPLDLSGLPDLINMSDAVRVVQWAGDHIPFAPPANPHSGCFFLNKNQLSSWVNQPWWLDHDTSFISPLESAATLGLAKTFKLFKPCLTHASWLDIQHFGTVFHELIGESSPNP